MDAERERKVQEIVEVLNGKGKRIPRSINELSPFPSGTFAALQGAFHAGQLRLFKHTFYYDAELFSLLAPGGLKFKHSLGMFLTLVGPIAAIAAGFLLSWWWLLAVPVAFFVGLSMTRSAYQQSIFLSALESEAAFCLLYFYRQVGVHDVASGRGYYWNAEAHSSAVS